VGGSERKKKGKGWERQYKKDVLNHRKLGEEERRAGSKKGTEKRGERTGGKKKKHKDPVCHRVATKWQLYPQKRERLWKQKKSRGKKVEEHTDRN